MLFLVGRSRLHTVKTSLRRSFATETMLRTALFTGRPLCNCYGKVMLGKQIKLAWQQGADYYCMMVSETINNVSFKLGRGYVWTNMNYFRFELSHNVNFSTIATSRSKGGLS